MEVYPNGNFRAERIKKSKDELICRLDTVKQRISELEVGKQKILSMKCREEENK